MGSESHTIKSKDKNITTGALVDSDDSDADDIYDRKINCLNSKLYNLSDSDEDPEELVHILEKRKAHTTTSTQETIYQTTQEIHDQDQYQKYLDEPVESIIDPPIKESRNEPNLGADNEEVQVDSDDSIVFVLNETSTSRNLDQDRENEHKEVETEYSNVTHIEDLSFHDLPFTLKMRYTYKVYKFDMKYNTKIAVALEDMKQKLGKTMTATHKGTPVLPETTPEKLQLSVVDILDLTETCDEDSNLEKIQLILQDGRSRNATFTFNFFKDKPFSQLRKLYSEKASVSSDKVNFQFDGDHVDENVTPNDLNLEDGDIIDVLVSN